jgi:hypothetical protein
VVCWHGKGFGRGKRRNEKHLWRVKMHKNVCKYIVLEGRSDKDERKK